MKLVPLALSILLTGSLVAQTPQFTDPANLRGERVKPRDGRELPIDSGVLGLQQLLRKLNTRASILNIVAHPDDEDGGMLTLYSRGLGARVTDLSLTRGEGGQNAMTGDFEDALGLLRTQELLANDRYTGVDQMFGTEVDFGFSKTKSEAFAKWTHDRVLYDAVRAIRLVRPLVITATFIGGVTDGHGQHQVSGQIAQEAFVAAADPKVFPDMIAEGILPWQALRVYARVPFADISAKGVFDYATGQYIAPHFVNYVTGKVSTTKPPTDVVVPEGTPDPLFTGAAANPSDLPAETTAAPSTPLSYAQFSRIGLFLQRSQIGKSTRLPTAGIYDSGYTLYGSVLCNDPAATRSPSTSSQNCRPEQVPRTERPATKPAAPQIGAAPSPSDLTAHPNFFTGIDTSIEGIATLAPAAFPPDQLFEVAHAISTATGHFDPARPEAIAPDLAHGLTGLERLIRSVESWNGDAIQKANALHELRIKRAQVNDALSLSLGLHLDAVAPAQHIIVGESATAHLKLTETAGETLSNVQCAMSNVIGKGILDKPSSADVPTNLTSNAPVNRIIQADLFFTGFITRPYFMRSDIEEPVYMLRDRGLRNAPATPQALTGWCMLSYSGTDLFLGQILTADGQPVTIVPAGSLSLSTHAQVLPNSKQSILIKTSLYPVEKPALKPKLYLPSGWQSHVAISDANAPGDTDFEAVSPIAHREVATISASAMLSGHQTIIEGYRPIGYGDLPRTNYYTPATTRIVPVDLQIPQHHNIAYLPGTGDAVPEALASINLTPTILTVADLTPSTLAKYDTVILGVRTYNAHPDLHGAPTQALLDYARNGGNVVVQYQTPEFTAADAPYPLSLGSNEKVIDETAPVKLLGICDNGTPAHWCEQSRINQAGTMPGSISDYKLLTTPNRIIPADFNNWIEERGHGFLSTWDAHYTALTETHDPGAPSERVEPQLPQRGGLITTPLGKGRWTYVAFALYRQLPEAVPGAYRLFLNLLNP